MEDFDLRRAVREAMSVLGESCRPEEVREWIARKYPGVPYDRDRVRQLRYAELNKGKGRPRKASPLGPALDTLGLIKTRADKLGLSLEEFARQVEVALELAELVGGLRNLQAALRTLVNLMAVRELR